ncbi:MAG: hypothetical protein A3C43_10775 [Candidatus Schekmanbacteria bacterium RIFCSPHIGHO2_02_FULL_38_11]|uniref:Periplasmic chaperone PpiD n=1 Tax=Candidatus Schekmanbacteria bacterium RIFCSPLOWO2_12_FULL_38_15 TaxID=1817883 RepID=A0A1F7SGQ4_9BACT|nr:MAG: hypothetical protein A2043_00230 [Candidatus Schekmanbacteria bacterium GWA2_38_9]OGL49623.1 MAG: hypothetical protein A3H37_01105 [Candidatus Schekmanbacteria bacterium RIFCSPLOWO2_02_FULL_38_14]OGL50345.1 MAG: hypothetical protein A3C43_10775 [Candidatus Schekmanbacteria bacterium RIFCSPHIGHO2_02_FULL_38_11]OGL52976.1 MAG: hypothetical protein A3G31_08660 [Candidatus Schekmanbacteria bacterium RIFCSPLOWO2_12_FULL_38_15]
MLDVMRKNIKSLSIFLWLVIFSFIAFYGVNTRNPSETESVAVVNGDAISFSLYRQEYYKTQEFFRNILKENADEYLKTVDLKKIVLDRLIERTLLSQLAKKMEITATDEELVDRLKKYDVFLNERGDIDNDRIVNVLEKNRIDPKNFMEEQKQEILVEKMKKLIEDSAKVSTSTVRDEYIKKYEKIMVEYAFTPNDFYNDNVNVNESDTKSYFDKNKENYRKPKIRKVKYTIIDTNGFDKDLKIGENEVRDYYNKNIDLYRAKNKEVRARHILFSLKPDAPKEEEEIVRKKAEKVLKEARNGKDFTALAQLNSDEPMATVSGGELGYFSKGRMVPEFEKAAFSLKKGEISDLVKTNFGYHIIKVEDILEAGTPRPFEYVKAEIRSKIINERKRSLGLEKANEVYNEWVKQKEKENLEEIRGNRIISDEIEEGSFIKEMGRNTDVNRTLAELREGEFSKPFLTGNGWVVLKLEKIIPSSLSSFEEVKEKVRKDVGSEKSSQMLAERAKEWSKSLNNKLAFKQIVDKKITVKESGEINRDSNLAGISEQENFKGFAFSLSEKNPATYFKAKDGYFLINLIKRIQIDEKDFEKKKNEFYKSLLAEEKNRVFTESIKNLKAQAEIKTYKEFL